MSEACRSATFLSSKVDLDSPQVRAAYVLSYLKGIANSHVKASFVGEGVEVQTKKLALNCYKQEMKMYMKLWCWMTFEYFGSRTF